MQSAISGIPHRRNAGFVISQDGTHRRDLDLQRRAAELQDGPTGQRGSLIRGNAGDDGIDRHPITMLLRPYAKSRLDSRGEPERTSAGRVVIKGCELAPAARTAQEHTFAHGDAAEGLRQRERIGHRVSQYLGQGDDHVGQGRLGNCEKSGVRRCAKASRPSCASSVI